MELVVLHKFKKWFNKFERYKVTYKNGGYHLANLFQSPPVGRSVRGYDQPFVFFHTLRLTWVFFVRWHANEILYLYVYLSYLPKLCLS
jgi:hypothetical protein